APACVLFDLATLDGGVDLQCTGPLAVRDVPVRPACRAPSGDHHGGAAESLSKGYYGVPKRDLVTGLQVLLHGGGLRIAAEMAGMRVKVGGEGREHYVEGLREGVPAGDGGAEGGLKGEGDRQAGLEQFGIAAVTAKEFLMRIEEKA
ncbi:MAG: hypothetical protein Q8P50_12235, partial [Bacillota bacterium]|nr:hypothetical protein [Bacillota bacterium]